MPTLKLGVAGMRDPADAHRLRRVLEAEPGVFGAVASHQDGCAEVDFEDDELALDRVLEIVRAAGFDPRLAG